MNILYIWIICALFNILKINQSYKKDWRNENWGIYPSATILAPLFTFMCFVGFFIFNKWHDE